MTDPTSRPDDELVSAVLDGEASADERARVDADPAAGQRLAELRAVRDLVAAPVAVPADQRERAVAAALAEFDAATGSSAGSGSAAPVPDPTVGDATPTTTGSTDELADRRARRGAGSGAKILAVAAAIIVVLVGAGAVIRVLNPPASQTVASSSAPAADRPQPNVVSGAGSGADSSEDSSSSSERPTTTSPAKGAVTTTIAPPSPTTSQATAPSATGSGGTVLVAVDLGTIATSGDLRDRMLGLVDRAPTDSATGAAPPTTVPGAGAGLDAVTSCASSIASSDPELGAVLAVGAAVYEGRPAVAYAFAIDQVAHPAANGSIRIYAVDPTTCATRSVLTVR